MLGSRLGSEAGSSPGSLWVALRPGGATFGPPDRGLPLIAKGARRFLVRSRTQADLSASLCGKWCSSITDTRLRKVAIWVLWESVSSAACRFARQFQIRGD